MIYVLIEQHISNCSNKPILTTVMELPRMIVSKLCCSLLSHAKMFFEFIHDFRKVQIGFCIVALICMA